MVAETAIDQNHHDPRRQAELAPALSEQDRDAPRQVRNALQ